MIIRILKCCAFAAVLSCSACVAVPVGGPPDAGYYGYGPDYPWAAGSVNVDIGGRSGYYGHGGGWHGGGFRGGFRR